MLCLLSKLTLHITGETQVGPDRIPPSHCPTRTFCGPTPPDHAHSPVQALSGFAGRETSAPSRNTVETK